MQHAAQNDCLLIILMIRYCPLKIVSVSIMPLYMMDRNQPVLYNSPTVMLPCYIPRVASELSGDWLSLHTQCFTHQLLPSTPPILLNYIRHVHLQLRLITAMECNFYNTCLWPPCVSPNLLDYSLQVLLIVHLITAFRFGWSWSPSVSQSWHNKGLAVYIWVHLIIIFRCTLKSFKGSAAASPVVMGSITDTQIHRRIDT